MQDVAKRAGVSLKTVSNVVNGFASIRPSTRARVQQALVELRYRPNMAARSLARGRTGLIALMIPDVERSYFGRLGGSLIRAAEVAGLVPVIHPSGGTVPGELDTLASLQAQLVDGLIATSLALTDADLVERLNGLPAVILGERWGPELLLDHVSIDTGGAARAAVGHLIEQGCTRIGLIGRRHVDFGPTDNRLPGALETLARAGLSPLIAEVGPYDRVHGYRAMTALLDRGRAPDAVFCFNDELAIGALAACSDRGVRCPDDVAVMGFDDTDEGRYATPALSSVRYSTDELATEMISLLQDAIRRRDDDSATYEPRELLVGYELVARASTVPGLGAADRAS